MSVAVLNLGSTSFRLVVAEWIPNQGRVQSLQKRESGASPVVAVATGALRDASDREKVVRRPTAAAGVPVRILSGDEEAALTLAAMRAGPPLGASRLAGTP